MSIDLKTCSYRKVEFLFDAMPTTGGRRLLKYQYPNSDKQSIEDQGRAPRTFNITAIIPHDDYYKKRNDLIEVLEKGGKGVFVHPTWGAVDNVRNGIYTIDERITSLGRATITIPFEVDDEAGLPVPSESLASQVSFNGLSCKAQQLTDLKDNFEVDLSFTGNFNDAIGKINEMGAKFTAASQLAQPIVGLADNFNKLVDSLVQNAGALIQAPADLSDAIGSVFESLNTLFELPEQVLGVMGSLFNYGDNDTDIKEITSGLSQRKSNRDIMNSTMQLVAVQYAYTAAAQTDFTNTIVLEETQKQLELQYLKIRDGGLSGFELSNAALDLIDIQRVSAEKNFDDKTVVTNSVITVNIPVSTPLSLILYNYYGHTDFMQEIVNINEIDLNAFVVGDLKILVEAQ